MGDVPADAEAEPPALRCVPCCDATTKTCRICLMEGEDDPEADPLVAPCSCKGSIEHIHLGCLRHWLQSKFGTTAHEGSCFKYEPPHCELCKSCLPRKVEGKRPLVALPQMQAPFVVLESRSRKNTAAALHAVSLASGKTVHLGRSRDCEVRINDMSLSRAHAGIRFDNGTFVLDDNKSKFGTLLALKKRHHVAAGQRVSVQVGRTLLAFGSPVQPEQ